MEMTQMNVGYHDNSSRWLPWVVCFSASLFFFYEFIQGNMFASIADNIMRDFHIQADKMAYLSSIYYFSNVIFLLFAGVILDRMSIKKVMIVAMTLCVASTFVLAYSESYYVALACRFVTGIGSAFCFLGPIRIASRWFSPSKMAMVTGAVVTMAMSGGMLAQYPMTRLVDIEGWRHALVELGLMGAIMVMVMVVGIKEKPAIKHEHSDMGLMQSWRHAYFNGQTIRAAIYTSLLNMPVAVLGAMIGTLYLMQRLGISKDEAAWINSFLFTGAIVGGPIVGWFSDKWQRRISPMVMGVIISIVLSLAILYLPLSTTMMAVMFFLLGFFTETQIISYALVAESNPAVMTATALSVISILTQGGYMVYQNLFSWLLMKHGEVVVVDGLPVYSLADYQYAILIIPAGLCVALIALYKLRETSGHKAAV